MHRALLALACFLLTACADVCTRAQALSESFPRRHADCFSADALPGPAVNADVCDDSMNACSAKDEQAIHAYFDCVERLAPCTRADVSGFNEKFLGCAKGMNALSPGCFRLE